MRPLDKVIEATIKLVPQDFPERAGLVNGLNSIKESYLFAAPEVVSHVWYRFSKYIADNLGQPDTAWKEEIADLIQGKKNYQEVLDA